MNYIKDMKVGEVGYTVYWCIYKVPNDLKLDAYTMRGDYTVTKKPAGTSNVRIVKRSENLVAVSVGALVKHKDEFETASLNIDWDWMAVVPMPNEC